MKNATNWLRFFAAIAIHFTALGEEGASAGVQGVTLTQYGHSSWRAQDGAIGGEVNSITQSTDGYLWVATDAGLLRYDGVEFKSQPMPEEGPVNALLGARDGSLWVGAAASLQHLVRGRVSAAQGWDGRAQAFVQDEQGDIWLARSHVATSPLCRIRHDKVSCFGAKDGLPCLQGQSLARDSAGAFWVGSPNGVCIWNPTGQHSQRRLPPAFENLEGATAIAALPDGSMLVGYGNPGSDTGLQLVREGRWMRFKLPGFDGSSLAIGALLVDRSGEVWIGTQSAGLYHVVNGRADHYSTADGLSGDGVQVLYQDREGSIWVGTTGGVDQFRHLAISTISTRQGLSADGVGSVTVDADGAVWMGNADGLDVLADNTLKHFGKAQGLPGTYVASLLKARDGLLWLGVDNDLAYFTRGKFHVVHLPSGGSLGVARSLAEDAAGDIWMVSVGHPQHIFRIRDGRFLDQFKLSGGAEPYGVISDDSGTIWIQAYNGTVFRYRKGELNAFPGPEHAFRQLAITADGALIGAGNDGIHRLKDGHWSVLDKTNGLPCNHVFATVEDSTQSLWMRTSCGIAVAKNADLSAFWAGTRRHISVKMLDASDGEQAGSASFWPSASRGPDGTLWFANDTVIQTVDPGHLPINSMIPPVHIEQLIADRQARRLGQDVKLPRLSRDLELDYSALSFIAPRKVRFRYRLAGYDAEWQDAGSRRRAFYTNLPPGRYAFQVIAANNDGIWNRVGDTVRFSIPPAFYQTGWFRGLLAILLIALLWLAMRVRVSIAIAGAETRLAERQSERIRIARELHDTLLQGFHGLLARFQVVANRLPSGGETRVLMDEILDRADDLLIEGRDRVRDLRAIEESSALIEELRRIGFELEREGFAAININATGEQVALRADVQREVMAIVREALANACRHAQADQIICRLDYGRASFVVTCTDNGVGIDQTVLERGGRAGHWGLHGMRERATRLGATLVLRSSTAGTVVEVRVKARIAYSRRPNRAVAWASRVCGMWRARLRGAGA